MSVDDERETAAVILRYADAIDRRDWPLFASCFTEDMEADYGELGRWRGRALFVDRMEKGHEGWGPTLHRMTNLVIAGEGEEATATSYVDALLMPGASHRKIRRACGWYHDRLLRQSDGWKIRYRRFAAVLISDAAEEAPQPVISR